MTDPFYNDNGPMPFRGIFEEEPDVRGRKPYRMLFNGGLLGPLGYPNGPMLPYVMGPAAVYPEEEEDPNP